MLINRVASVLHFMKEASLTQMVITDPASVFYLTGKMIAPEERFLALYLNQSGEHRLFVNELFTVTEDLGVTKVFFPDVENGVDRLAEMTDSDAVLGIDKNMAARFLLRLMDLSAASGYVCASECVDQARGCKDEEEQRKMIEVSAINDRAMAEFKQLIHPGITEKEAARQMEAIYLALGADGCSFEPLVGFGANAAEGHHEPDDTVLKEGDCVLLDVGCICNEYCADMTRTFFYETVSEKAREVYELVKKANETAEAMIRPGVRFCDIDAAARKVIDDQGYGEYFTHRLGHSIGIEVHEYGDVSAANERCVEEGMVFSVEPGIYLPGELGVRIEDLVMVTKDGMQRLNQYSKELQIIHG